MGDAVVKALLNIVEKNPALIEELVTLLLQKVVDDLKAKGA